MRIVVLLAASLTLLSGQEVKRPRITGVAHAAIYVSDIGQARAFYKDFLGYGEARELNNADGTLSLTFIKINDRQYVELFPEREKGSDRLAHISIETGDAEALRRYLASRGVAVPEKVNKGRVGNLSFNVKDPDGHIVEVTQYLPDSDLVKKRGMFAGPERISERMAHVGILVGALQPALDFYGKILGFEETWRGTRDPKQLSWVNMKVPDGDDYIEFMLYKDLPEPSKRGTAHHICLFVPDMDKALARLKERKGYDKPMEIRTGVNRRRQLNLYDPDGTRVELMEPHTVDGNPVPSSTAPPPR